jgi:hypothetical protein
LRHIIGLDLGKLSDPTALAVLRWSVPPAPPRIHAGLVTYRARQKPAERIYEVPTLRRWPLSTPYADIVKALAAYIKGEQFREAPPMLVLDETGVGTAVCERVRAKLREEAAPCSLRMVTITAGAAVSLVGPGRWHVAKKELASRMQVLLGQRRLQVAPDLAEAKQLVRELGTFQVKITAAGNETFESWRERDHDDLVLAVALAAWAAEGPGLERWWYVGLPGDEDVEAPTVIRT